MPEPRPVAEADGDAALVRRARAGDDDAFAALYSAYRGAVFAVCLKVLRERESAEDIVQETFLRAYACLDRYDERRPLRPWLRAIATRRCIDLLRRSSRNKTTDGNRTTDDIEEHLLEEPEEDPTLAAVIALEDRGRLERALRKLHPRHRRALMLYALEGWTYADIAEAEGISIGATKSLVFHARDNLRRACRRGLYGTIVAGLMALRRRVARRTTTMESRLAGSVEPIAASFAPVSSGVAAVVLSLMTAAAPSLAVAPRGSVASAPITSNVADLRSGAGGGSGSNTPRGRPMGLMGSLLNPTKDATPEQTQFKSVTPSPNYSNDHTLVAAGYVSCPQGSCAVLFFSRDGGRSWARHPTRDFHGETVLLPPSYPADKRIFAMGTQGLEVSEDGGTRFDVVLPIRGDTAISPLFDGNDDRLVIGATVVTEYWPDQGLDGLSKPATLVGPSGKWMTVAFSPEYPVDHVLYVGGIRPDTAGHLRPTVNRCADSICDSIVFDAGSDAPFVRPSTNFAHDDVVYAFTSHVLFRSTDAGRTFSTSEPSFASRASIRDVQVLRNGTVLAAVTDDPSSSGVFRSVDGGVTWTRQAVPLSGFAAGVARVVVLPDGRLIALAAERGLACSYDGGRRWTSRCGG